MRISLIAAAEGAAPATVATTTASHAYGSFAVSTPMIIPSRTAAVTVIANDATTSDALATTCSLLQPEQIRPLLAAEDTAVRALVFTRSADGVAQRTLYGRDPSGLVSRP